MISHDDMRAVLVSRYPEVWKSVRGFEFDVGWLPIVDSISRVLMKVDPIPQAFIVKEKFGGLRFSTRKHVPEMMQMLMCAEQISERTCEITGARGRLMSRRGWWQTLAPGVDQDAISPAEYRKQRVRSGVALEDSAPLDQTVSDVAARFPRNLIDKPSIPEGYADLLECLLHSLSESGWPPQPSGQRVRVFQTFDGLQIELEKPDVSHEAVADFCRFVSECIDPISRQQVFK